MKKSLGFNINGTRYEAIVEPHRTLLELLWELGLTGTKMGCNTGECGACTVLLDGIAVCSCMMLAWHAQDKRIVTIEGLAFGGRLHPLQQAFIDSFAIQCGYCTPGMIMSAKALLDENPDPTEDQVRRALQGNLCRCTGYTKIVEAVMTAKNKITARSFQEEE